MDATSSWDCTGHERFPLPLSTDTSTAGEGLLWFLGLERTREGSGEGEEVEIAGKCMQMLVEGACPRH